MSSDRRLDMIAIIKASIVMFLMILIICFRRVSEPIHTQRTLQLDDVSS